MFEVTSCDLKAANSSTESWEMKSAVKRSRLRLTACTRTLVATPYTAARWVCVVAGSRKRTKARTTYTETSMARGLLRMLAAMMAPCSVKARGRYLRCWPRPGA